MLGIEEMDINTNKNRNAIIKLDSRQKVYLKVKILVVIFKPQA